MERVLVTGAAGYIGSVLCRLLLKEGFNVRGYDILNFGGESIIELLNDEHFEFIKGDVRDENSLNIALKDVDYVAHLAAIVGDPACAKEPDIAKETNLVATKKLYCLANKNNVKRLVFSSTCSNYGKMSDPGAFVNEESLLAPVSLYAETKVGVEKFLMSQAKENECKPICLRFSTVYGLSPRMRFDLTVNEFSKELSLERELVIFGEQFWRPYCHVKDLARSIVQVIKADIVKVAFEVFNVGDTNENYTKQMLANELVKQLPEAKVSYVEKNEDPRDYRVNFDKIKRVLNFRITKTVPEGISDVIKVVKEGFLNDLDSLKYKNI